MPAAAADDGLTNIGYFGVQDLTAHELDKREHVEMDCGDTVFFHPLTIHGSGINKVALQNYDAARPPVCKTCPFSHCLTLTGHWSGQ